MASSLSRRALSAIAALLVVAAGACSRSGEQPQSVAAASARMSTTAPAEAAEAAAPAPPAPAEPAPAEPAPPPPLTVPEKLDQIVATVADRDVAVSIVDDTGAVVLEHRADAPVIPASTAKLATAAAALADLGPEFHWVTRVKSTAPVTDGVINGDIVLIGGGDPTLSGGRYAEVMPERPRASLEQLADEIVAAGTTRITGRLIADASFFPAQPFADGVAHTGGDSSPPSSGLTVDAGRRVWVDARGTQSVPSADPAQEALTQLAAALAVRNVAIDGGAVRGDGAGATAPLPLADVDSPPLVDVLRHMIQTSDNQVADAVFRTIGARHGDASWAGSAAAVTGILGAIGFDTAQIQVADGSGLSRNGRITAHGLVLLEEVAAASKFATSWYSLHAVAGSSGTLKKRLVDTPAAGRVAGKTGTLNGVRALAAFVTDGSKPRFRMAVVGNGLDDAGIAAVLKAQDDIALVLAERAAACAGQPACPAA